MRVLIITACLSLFSILTACGGGGEKPAPLGGAEQEKAEVGEPGKILEIPVIPKGTTHSFWLSVRAGAMAAAEELGVKAIWQGL